MIFFAFYRITFPEYDDYNVSIKTQSARDFGLSRTATPKRDKQVVLV